MKKVLILDDDSYYQLAAKAAIDGAFEAVCPNCFEIVNEIKNDLGKYLTKIISEEKPCVIVTDIMYGHSPALMYAGFDIAQYVKENYPDIPVIGMSNGCCAQKRMETSGMFKLIAKTWLKTGLLSAIQECLDSKQQ